MSDSSSPAQSSQSPAEATTTPSPTTSSASSQTTPVTTDSSTPTTTTQSSTPTPTSTTTTSTSTSSSSSSSNAPTSSSDDLRTSPSSSSSSSPTSTSTFASPSSSPSTTTQPPTSSSSSSSHTETITTITSSYTAYVSGSPIVTTTTIPSTIPQLSSASSSDRSAVIAGSAAGGTAVIILLLSLAFVARRKRFKRLRFLDTIMLRRNRIRSRATLLDGDDIPEPTPRRYTDYETPWDHKNVRDGTGRALMAGETPGPALTAAPHWSETGSAFREDVWPPPGEASRLMDPLANRDDLDLGRIVDDVMGPSVAATHFSDQSISSVYRGSTHDSEAASPSRKVSNGSHAALLEAAGLAGLPSTAPVHSSPLAQLDTGPESVERTGGNVS